MSDRKLKINDRVILIGGNYSDCPADPYWGKSQGRVIGTITKIVINDPDDDEYEENYDGPDNLITVEWDNGSANKYLEENLMLYNGIKKKYERNIKYKNNLEKVVNKLFYKGISREYVREIARRHKVKIK